MADTLIEQPVVQPTTSINTLTGQPVAPMQSIPVPTPAQVYSPQNVAATFTAPAKAPNLSDPYGLYDQFLKSPEITTAQTEAKTLTEELNALRQGVRSQVAGIGNLPENLNVLRGFQREAADVGALKEQALAENLQAKQDYLSSLKVEAQNRYQIAQQERGQLQDLIRQTGGKAGIKYTDSFESALKKASKYEEETLKEAEKKTYKDSLKKQIQELGGSTRGLNTKELEKKLRKKLKEDGASEAELKQLEIDLKRKELAKPYYKPESGNDDFAKTEKALYSDIDKLRKQMSDKDVNWSTAWNTINSRYQGFEPYEIDELLGTEFRNKYDK